ncbi:Potassium-transporting ATPase ATP-binding subunit [anaerobic digester metagenome]
MDTGTPALSECGHRVYHLVSDRETPETGFYPVGRYRLICMEHRPANPSLPAAGGHIGVASWSEAVHTLQSDTASGLMAAEAARRIEQYGYNEVQPPTINPATLFAQKFWGITAWMLEITIVISLLTQRYLDAAIILVLLFFNSITGFIQERRASAAVESLKQTLQVNARVLRNGQWGVLPARELVPGDIARIRAGDFVPADIVIIDGETEVDQSALTGESESIGKRANDLLYSGSIIKRGEATGIVVSTGIRTYFGKTTQLVQTARPALHVEEITARVVRWLAGIVGISVIFATIVSVLRGFDIIDILPLMLVLLVSAIPVALPAMFSISTALGSVDLGRKGILVTRLSATEDAATMDILCTDKTGTITTNRLSITDVKPFPPFTERDAVVYGALASRAADQDPIDRAFIAAAQAEQPAQGAPHQKEFIPFDPETRRTEALIQRDGKEFRVSKGAVRVIADLCRLSDTEKGSIETETEEFAKKGYKTLAIARTDDDGAFRMVGLVALYDAPRHDSKDLIRELMDLGVSVKILTGDSAAIADEIAKEVGLSGKIVGASDITGSLEDDPGKAADIAEKNDGFAEIYPADKYAIVKSLQGRRHIVGMTGDGVNDAPALKQAEVGIAVSNATDVAKDAASVVLTGEGLANIVDLVKTARMINQRLVTWVLNKIIKTILTVSLVVGAFLITGTFVIGTFDLVLLLFVIDFVTLSLSTDTVRWSRKPDAWNISALSGVSLALGLFLVLESAALLYIGIWQFELLSNIQELHTFTFQILFYSGVFTIFVVRERGRFWHSMPGKPLIWAVIIDMAVIALITTIGVPGITPVPPHITLFVILFTGIFALLVNDTIKVSVLERIGFRW